MRLPAVKGSSWRPRPMWPGTDPPVPPSRETATHVSNGNGHRVRCAIRHGEVPAHLSMEQTAAFLRATLTEAEDVPALWGCIVGVLLGVEKGRW